ncbi:MAG: amino acid ABC transporter permease [Verrucomicrobiales bacterium]
MLKYLISTVVSVVLLTTFCFVLWVVASHDYHWEAIRPYWGNLISGWWVTLLVSAAALVLSVVIGVLLTGGQLSGHRLPSVLCRIFVEFIRGTPLLTQILIGYYLIPKSQWLSARAIGFTGWQTYRFVVIPQAIRRVLPASAGQFANLIKDSSLLFVISVHEFTMQSREINANSYSTFEAYLPLIFGYFLLTFPISLLSRYLESRFRYEH